MILLHLGLFSQHQRIEMIDRLKAQARALKRDTAALVLAYRDVRTPWYARVVAALVVAYLFSPIDLIPDFIPVLGYLDDLLLVPLGIRLALRLIPPEVMDDARRHADTLAESRSTARYVMAGWIVVVWLVVLFFIGRAVWGWFQH
jgi:uncharacterized membrane protein YkvA (DUF1232 family)